MREIIYQDPVEGDFYLCYPAVCDGHLIYVSRDLCNPTISRGVANIGTWALLKWANTAGREFWLYTKVISELVRHNFPTRGEDVVDYWSPPQQTVRHSFWAFVPTWVIDDPELCRHMENPPMVYMALDNLPYSAPDSQHITIPLL